LGFYYSRTTQQGNLLLERMGTLVSRKLTAGMNENPGLKLSLFDTL
jgi:hypothetical protein